MQRDRFHVGPARARQCHELCTYLEGGARYAPCVEDCTTLPVGSTGIGGTGLYGEAPRRDIGPWAVARDSGLNVLDAGPRGDWRPGPWGLPPPAVAFAAPAPWAFGELGASPNYLAIAPVDFAAPPDEDHVPELLPERRGAEGFHGRASPHYAEYDRWGDYVGLTRPAGVGVGSAYGRCRLRCRHVAGGCWAGGNRDCVRRYRDCQAGCGRLLAAPHSAWLGAGGCLAGAGGVSAQACAPHYGAPVADVADLSAFPHLQ